MREHHFSLGAGSLAIDQAELQDEWVSTDYEIGDSLIFHSLTVHQALPNVTEDRLRVSLDNRYQAVAEPIAEHMLQPHLQGHHMLTWDDVYRDWTSTELQYYWKTLPIDEMARIERWGTQSFNEALALAH
ncbi:MAG: phytanoyl-CoA dioxygenase family protein [candidate division Zixibacteria bacterium]|nr:phytanoyl-CoA dioxygenase family protein [candidate division Zixibacteria bacterium]